MQLVTAQNICSHVACLSGIAATFEATFGRSYKLTNESSEDARRLVEAGLATQRVIAELLDPATIASRHRRYHAWWQHSEMIDLAIVKEMAVEAFNLVSAVAYHEARGASAQESPSIFKMQCSIAGMLSPDALPIIHPVQEAV